MQRGLFIKSIIVTALFLNLYSCKKSTKDSAPLLEGKIINAPSLIILQRLDSIPIDVDTIEIKQDGSFRCENTRLQSDFYRLCVGNQQINLILSSDSTTQVSFDYFSIPNTLSFSGFNQSEILQKVLNSTKLYENEFRIKSDTIKHLIGSVTTDSIVHLLYDKQDSVTLKYRLVSDELLKGNEASLVAIPLLLQQAGNTPLYAFPKDRSLFIETQFLLSQRYFNSYQVKRFSNLANNVSAKLDGYKRLSVGDKMPDFEAFTPWNDKLSLNSLLGKNVMVIVWSYELPICRIRNKEISKLMWRYKNQGLETYMISLDTNAIEWQKTNKEDELNCLHVSDLRGKSSPIIPLLGIDALPALFLINSEGIIVEKNIWGEKLEDAIQRLVKKRVNVR